MTTSAGVYIPVWANSSLIQYSGDWNMTAWPYHPMNENSSASINFTGNGIAAMGSGNLGGYSGDGGLFTIIDNSSTSPFQGWEGGSGSNDSTNLLSWYMVPPGQHSVQFHPGGSNTDFLFGGFQLSAATSWTPKNDTGITYAGGDVDDLQFFNNGKDTTVWPDGLAYNGSAVNVTYVSGQNSGFAFNFTGVGVYVYTAHNATEATSYSVYFNQSQPPSASDNIHPFNTYNLKAGTGGLLFMAGALPAGEHRVLIVNTGSGRLGYQAAYSILPDHPLYNSTVCYVNCTQAQRDTLTGTKFSKWSSASKETVFTASAVMGLIGLALGLQVLF